MPVPNDVVSTYLHILFVVIYVFFAEIIIYEAEKRFFFQFATPEHNFTIITGPNMGGKSIYIKQIAVMQVMAQVSKLILLIYFYCVI